MKILIVANWKMNLQTLVEAKTLFNSIKKGIKNVKNACPVGSRRLSFGVEAVICPPFVYLPEFKTTGSKLKLGAQDCFYEEKGAYTGEISPIMLKNLGCQYVILGHSERRKYFRETDEIINKKLKAAIRAKLKPIFCVGENREERERGETQMVLKCQIENGLKGIKKREITNLVLAYEPVWAVGTGKPCSTNEAQTMSLFLRKIVAKNYSSSVAKNLSVLYGGSVNGKNAKDYVLGAGMSGFLIGGASLDAKEFVKIIKDIKEA